MLLAQTAIEQPPDRVSLSAFTGKYAAVLLIAVAVSLILTPIMRTVALKKGIVDLPDLRRKNHAKPVAYLGGLAIFLAWCAGLLAAYFLIFRNQAGASEPVYMMVAIFLGAATITVTGLVDDIYGISPRVKIGGQFFAAAALANQDIGVQLVANSFQMLEIPASPQLIYVLGTAVIAAFVIGGCNAMNLIDGLDGLAGGVAALCCVGFALVAVIVAMNPNIPGQEGDHLRIVMCLAIIGALIGFLVFNFNPASIFMGDTGSLLLGFLCVTTIMLFANTGVWALKLATVGLIIFAVPIIDTSWAIVRRKLRGQPISSPDNEHMHHLFRRSGLSVKQSVFSMYAITAVFAAVGVGLAAATSQWGRTAEIGRWRSMLIIGGVLYAVTLFVCYKSGRKLALRDIQQDKLPEAPDPAEPAEPRSPEPNPPLAQDAAAPAKS